MLTVVFYNDNRNWKYLVLALITCSELSSFAPTLSNADCILSEIGMFNQINMNKVKVRNLLY